MYGWMYVCMDRCMYVCIYVLSMYYVCLYVCVCMYVYVCMYVCMYVFVCQQVHCPVPGGPSRAVPRQRAAEANVRPSRPRVTQSRWAAALLVADDLFRMMLMVNQTSSS